jgi:hypothetical protein
MDVAAIYAAIAPKPLRFRSVIRNRASGRV